MMEDDVRGAGEALESFLARERSPKTLEPSAEDSAAFAELKERCFRNQAACTDCSDKDTKITALEQELASLRAPRLARQQALQSWVQDICERREYVECWHAEMDDAGSRRDCGWWDDCDDCDCSLHKLREYVGLEQRPDGATRAPR